MNVIKGTFIGFVFGFILSIFTSWGFMVIAQLAAGGGFSIAGEQWLYYATALPFAVAFMLLGAYFSKREEVSTKKLWFISSISALLVTLYSGTIGVLLGEWVIRGGSLITPTEGGYTGVNIEGVLVWGVAYAFILIPITIPVARLMIQGFLTLLQKFKRTN